MEEIAIYRVEGGDVLILAVLVWFLGSWLTSKIQFLAHYNIPVAVTGGILCSTTIALIYSFGDLQIDFDMRLRNLMLLVFFTTIGLSAKFSLLKEGGKALFILLAIAMVLLVFQNTIGVILASLLGGHPAYGLFGGSISFAGGYGTAIAWGDIAENAGLVGAKEIGIAFATFGLITGGIIGGPIAEWLMKRHGLKGRAEQGNADDERGAVSAPAAHISEVLGTLMILAICVEAGDLVNRLLFARGVTLPGFLTAMVVGIVITNASDVFKWRLSSVAIERAGEISLQLFLSMSLMSMQLWVLATAVGPIVLVVFAQMLVITLLGVFVVFRAMGRDYDACVTVAGFTGLGLGATPVGIANMNAVTEKYGPSPKSFLVVPLVGAFFIDIANALIIKFFIGLPLIQEFHL